MASRYKTKNRMRKSTKYTFIIISIIMLVFSLSSLFNNLQEESSSTFTKEVYRYTDKFHYDYKINLVNNKYMTNNDVVDKNLAYVTDLIQNINLDLNYEYSASKQSDLNYTYWVEGKMQVVYTKNGEEQKIWEKSEKLLKEKTEKVSSDNFKIKEKLELDLKEKNKILNDFKQQLGMTIDAKYTVTLKVKVSTNVEEKEVIDEFSPVINVDLAEKTTKLSGENDTERTEYISKEYKVTEQQITIIIIIDGIITLIAVILLIHALRAKSINKIKNPYKYELNRLLKICQDKIVEVSTKPNDEELEVIFVNDFGEIVKISEELFKPILYYNKKENEEAWFSVMSGKTSYRYILKK
ncbi:MAG: hypothetical protein IKF17_05180 [Clostridia bacterium]|nr:hypothetical protein [Clostridia bacterium]